MFVERFRQWKRNLLSCRAVNKFHTAVLSVSTETQLAAAGGTAFPLSADLMATSFKSLEVALSRCSSPNNTRLSGLSIGLVSYLFI